MKYKMRNLGNLGKTFNMHRSLGSVVTNRPSLLLKNLLDRFFSNFANILPIIREFKRGNKTGGGGGALSRF